VNKVPFKYIKIFFEMFYENLYMFFTWWSRSSYELLQRIP
jgi:hypothetical protein